MEVLVTDEAPRPRETSESPIPIQPLFRKAMHTLDVHFLEDSLIHLTSKNDEAQSESATETKREKCMEFRTGNSVVFLFELCKYFKLLPEVQYRAVDLFHRFMTSHVVELCQRVQSGKSLWCDVEKRLKDQIVLQAASCVQLASKLSTRKFHLTINNVKAFLTSHGFPYTREEVIQSEVRVLKTLQYRVDDPTPLEYVEVLLGSLVHNDKTVPAEHLHALSLKVLDVFYLRRRQIHEKLAKVFSQEVETTMPVSVETDKMFLASSVITAAGFIMGQARTQQLPDQLSQITSTVSQDIILFASVLLEEVYTDDSS